MREILSTRGTDPLTQSAFNLAKMRKNWSVFPLVGILTMAVCGALGFSSYSALTKSDVNFKHGTGQLPRHERLDLENYRPKLYTIHEKHMPHSERDKLLKEIGSYKF